MIQNRAYGKEHYRNAVFAACAGRSQRLRLAGGEYPKEEQVNFGADEDECYLDTLSQLYFAASRESVQLDGKTREEIFKQNIEAIINNKKGRPFPFRSAHSFCSRAAESAQDAAGYVGCLRRFASARRSAYLSARLACSFFAVRL